VFDYILPVYFVILHNIIGMSHLKDMKWVLLNWIQCILLAAQHVYILPSWNQWNLQVIMCVALTCFL